jgi:poly(hydroxyalkanoate) granule-associated protein
VVFSNVENRRNARLRATREGDFSMTVETMQRQQPALETDAGAASDVSAKRGRMIPPAVEQAAVSVRKLVLAYVGAGAFVVDGAAAVYHRGERLLTSAEKRGAVMEQTARRRFGSLEEQAVHEMRKLQGQAEENMQHVLQSGGEVNEEVEKRVELVLANMGLPSRERLQRLSQEIDALNQKLDAQIMRLPAEPISDQLG